MNHTIVDQNRFVLDDQATAAQNYLEELLLSENPGKGMISPEDWVGIADHLHLSPRELCVATLLFEGNSRKQIAKRMNCSPDTTRVYIDRLFAKLNVADRLGMVLRVVRVHLALAERCEPVASHKSVTCMK